MNRILVVDDDHHIRELIATLLKNEGFNVVEAIDGRDAFNQLDGDVVDLCILDIMMPNMDGYAFCERARRYYDFPILMLTAKAETSQKVKGLELGADDYLTKPFESAELIARVKVLLRRYNIAYSQTVTVGQVIVDRNRFSAEMDGVRYDLPKKEFELLFAMASYAGKTFSRDQLIETVWGYDFDGNERTLDVHINRLRDRFPQEKAGFKITTIRGLGYRLEAT